MNRCPNCGQETHKKYCCVKCQNEYQNFLKIKKYYDAPKTCAYCGKELEYERRSNKFCSRSCSASYNNSRRKLSNDTKEKIRKSINSLKTTKILTCAKCGSLYPANKLGSSKKFCSRSCIDYYQTHRNEFLAESTKLKLSKAGRKSATIQANNRRSKNEKYFYELCSKHFNDVRHNEPIFNGWDADVIIIDIKYAIMWNGPWHYKMIKRGSSLKQIQNRDNIKVKEIIKSGYTPYIIKDMGKHDKQFVESEFDKFIEYIKNSGVEQ